MDRRDFLLTAKQFKAIKAGNGIQLSHAQLTNPSKVHRHPMSVNMYPEGLKKLKDSVAHSKGFRMIPDRHFTNEYQEYAGEDDIFEGGNLFGDIGKSIKSVGKSAKKELKKAAKSIEKTAKSTYADANQFALKNDVGGIVEEIKSGIGQNNTQLIIQGALMSTGMDEQSANVMAGTATGAVYGVDFGESLKGQGKDALKGGVKGGLTSIIKQNKKPSVPTKSGGSFLGNGFDNAKLDKALKRASSQVAKAGSGFDPKKMETVVRQAKNQIAKGGSFIGNGYMNFQQEPENVVLKTAQKFGKYGGSFRD